MSNEALKRAVAYGADKLVIVDTNRLSSYLKGGKSLFYHYVLTSVSEIVTTYLTSPGAFAATSIAASDLLKGLSSWNPGNVLPASVAGAMAKIADVLDPPGLYRFLLNPQSVDFNYAKLQNIQKYGFESFELQYFGNDILGMKCSGQTTMLEPQVELLEIVAHLYQPLYESLVTFLPLHLLSPAWIKLNEFSNFYKQSTQQLLIIWNWNVYFGYLTDFSYNWNVERAYRISYNFGFQLHPSKQWKLFNLTDEAFKAQERETNINLASAKLADIYF